jgi:hypothetical protein
MSKTMRRPLPLEGGTPEELVSPGAVPGWSLDFSWAPPGVGVGEGVGVMVCAGDALLVGVGVVVAASSPEAPAPEEPGLGALLTSALLLGLAEVLACVAERCCAEAEPDGRTPSPPRVVTSVTSTAPPAAVIRP